RFVEARQTTDMTLVSRPGSLYLADISITDSGFSADFRAAAPVLYLPETAPVGTRWSWTLHSTNGSYTLAGSFELTGPVTQTVAGRPVRCLGVDSTLTITGSGLDVVDTQTDAAYVAEALIVHETSRQQGTAYGVHFHSQSVRTVGSLRPS
ncbi:MAG: hypothetical protein ACYDB7_09890, partial [Mycobacteriales bacterium]